MEHVTLTGSYLLLLILLLQQFLVDLFIGRIEIANTTDQLKVFVNSVLYDCRDNGMIVTIHRLDRRPDSVVFGNLQVKCLFKIIDTEKI